LDGHINGEIKIPYICTQELPSYELDEQAYTVSLKLEELRQLYGCLVDDFPHWELQLAFSSASF